MSKLCKMCLGKGHWENEFLDDVYCECPAGRDLKFKDEMDALRDDCHHQFVNGECLMCGEEK